MELEKVYENIINGTAILITGSGAHINVHTPDGKPFPSGVSLAERLYQQCDIMNIENPWDLQDASETYIDKYSKERLITEIKTQLMVGNVEDEHRKLYSCNWQRIYTTNYDNVPRISTMGEKESLIPITLGMKRRDEYLQQKICVYINGYIERLDEKTLDDEFKLTGKSYLAASNLENSEWGAVFAEDIETADSIVIVGLSLDYDLDIKRFIYNKNVKDKIVFIEKEEISDSKTRKMERLGEVKKIGMEKFVNDLIKYKEQHISDKTKEEYTIYKSFSVYDKKNTMKKATTFEVYDLFMRGEIKDCLWNRKDGKYKNITPFSELCVP